jgi:hypothetical protein
MRQVFDVRMLAVLGLFRGPDMLKHVTVECQRFPSRYLTDVLH